MNKFFGNINLWLSLFFLLLYFSFASILDFSWSKDYYQNKIQTSVLEISSKMDSKIASLESLNLEDEFYSNNRIELLAYKNDSLIYWSNYKFPILSLDSLSAQNDAIIFQEPGIYYIKTKIWNQKKLVLFYRLQSKFAFENEYLKNEISHDFKVPEGIEFSKRASSYAVKNNKGTILAYLNFIPTTPSTFLTILLSLFLILSFIFFISYLFIFLENCKLNRYVERLIIYFFLILIFILFSYTNLFSYLRTSSIFQPESFAFSSLLPSMISLFIGSVCLILFLLIETKWLLKSPECERTKLFSLLLFVIYALVYSLFIETIEIISNNTSANLDLSNIASLDIIGISGITIMILLAINFLMLSNLITLSLRKSAHRITKVDGFIILLMGSLVYLIRGLDRTAVFNGITLVVLYGIILFKLSNKTLSQSGFYIALAVLISYIINYNLVEINNIKEHNKREILIRSLALNQDPEAEYIFGEIEDYIYRDTVLHNIISTNWLENETVSNYILQNYFANYKHFRKYDFQITLCDQQTNLLIRPSNMEVSCDDFFYKNLISKGYMTSNKNLYRLEYGSGQINYLGLFRFVFNQDLVFTVYIEINSKIKRKGFTKLLSPSGFDPFEKIRSYSLAKYEGKTIAEAYGEFTFPYEIEDSLKSGTMAFLDAKGYNHLFYKLNHRETFVLSKPQKGLLSQIAPFAYLFILIIITSILFLPYFNKVFKLWLPPQSFSFRLQMSFISLLAISLVIIALISTFYIKELNHEKDAKALKKTAFSLQTEFEHKLANSVSDGDNMQNYLNELSIKFSKVFNADINLYSLNGALISTTKPELYKYHFISDKINPEALRQLREQKSTYLNFKESIGKLEYYSAYMPFHNTNNEVVAYLNLPYFAQQDQLKKDVSNFVMTLMNVYTFMIVISILLILLLSNYIIRPLKMIKEMMQKISLGKENKHINWVRKDEIGELVVQYNHMVDELAKSADILAKSERESAWRQMAQQVAHEIKNPLTPMKLSVQYLIRTLNDGKPDWEERLRKLSNTLIEQIDALASIATAFSDFAKMPVSKKENFDLKEAIEASIKIFQDYENINIAFSHQEQDYMIFGDKKNLIRVFNNLIKNAIQSIPFNQDGFLDVDIQEDGSHWKVAIKDNGSGIPVEEQDKIFIPNFTTKSGGMGLGLAMVRNIILSQGGNIDFETEVGKGTTFYIYLKKSIDE